MTPGFYVFAILGPGAKREALCLGCPGAKRNDGEQLASDTLGRGARAWDQCVCWD